jgi:hypothetical protein
VEPVTSSHGRLQAVARAGTVALTPLVARDERPAVFPVFASATLVKGKRAQPLSLPDPMLSAMDAPDNRLDDFPPETFTVVAFCGACGHQAPLDRARVPAGVSVQRLRGRLRCSGCGSHEAQIRILYTGAGRFRYRPAAPIGPTGA